MRTKRTLTLSILSLGLFISTQSYAQEICNNGIDDDNDGRVDCFDGECSGDNACDGFFIGDEFECSLNPTPDPSFDLALKWGSKNGTNNTHSQPLVGDVDGDGIAEVVVVNRFINKITVLNGEDGSVYAEVTTTWNGSYTGGDDFTNDIESQPAIADVDGDGFGEIFISDDDGNRIERWDIIDSGDGGKTGSIGHHDGSTGPTWHITSGMERVGIMGLADFNKDGTPELYHYNEIINPITGAILIAGSTGNEWKSSVSQGAIAADLLTDIAYPGIELSSMGRIYYIDLDATPPTRTLVKQANDLVFTANHTLKGHSVPSSQKSKYKLRPKYYSSWDIQISFESVADYNNDGFLDVIGSGSFGTSNTGYTTVYFWDVKNDKLITYQDPNNNHVRGTGRINLGDVNANGTLNATFVSNQRLYALDASFGLLWKKTIDEGSSGVTGCSIFDFNDDGQMEILYRSEKLFYIVNGETGATRKSFTCISRTWLEYPVVADIDGDGESEICITCLTDDGGNTGYSNSDNGQVRIFEPADDDIWQPSRAVWNQHGYFNVNINDDLSVPKEQQNHAIFSDTTCGDGQASPLNSFINQAPFLANSGCPQYNEPGISIGFITFDSASICPSNDIYVSIEVINSGDVNLTGALPVTFYDGNPTDDPAAATKLNTIYDAVNIAVGEKDTLNLTVSAQNSIFDLYAVLNDDGTSTVPLTLGAINTGLGECSTLDNMNNTGVSVRLNPFALSAEKTRDNIKCVDSLADNGQAIAYIDSIGEDNSSFSFFWVAQSDPGTILSTNSSYIGMEEGDYLVYALNDTANCLSDTIAVNIPASNNDSINVFIETTDMTSCNPVNGSLVARVIETNGDTVTAGYSYAWETDTGQDGTIGISSTLSPVAADNYVVAVTSNISGCSASKDGEVGTALVTPAVLFSDTIAVTDCADPATGSMTVTAPGHPNAVSVEWYKTTINGSPLFTGTTYTALEPSPVVYRIRVKDAITNCATDTLVSIPDSTGAPALEFAQVVQNTSCNTVGNGFIRATSGNETAGFAFDFFTGDNTLDANKWPTTGGDNGNLAFALTENLYTIRVTDSATNCIITDTTSIFDRPVKPTVDTSTIVIQDVYNCGPNNSGPETGSIESGAIIGAGGEILGINSTNNGGFEEPDIFAMFGRSNYKIFDESDLPGWNTTATDNKVELWKDGFNGVPAYDGTQFAEINANREAALYFDLTTLPGSIMEWSFAHRGRGGIDSIELLIGASGGVEMSQGIFGTDNDEWKVYSGSYIVPVGQTLTRFQYKAAHTASPSNSVGNFIDGIKFEVVQFSYNLWQGNNSGGTLLGTNESGDFSDLASGHYTITIQDSLTGCLSDDIPVFVDLFQNFPVISDTTVAANIGCTGVDLGSIAIEAESSAGAAFSEPFSGYEFKLFAGGDTTSLQEIVVGTDSIPVNTALFDTLNDASYTIKVTNNESNCFVLQPALVPSDTENPVLLDLIPSDVTNCSPANGRMRAIVSNDSGNGYEYTWYAGASDASPVMTDSTSDAINNIDIGTYTAIAIDSVTRCASSSKTESIADASPDMLVVPTEITSNSSCELGNGVAGAYVDGAGFPGRGDTLREPEGISFQWYTDATASTIITGKDSSVVTDLNDGSFTVVAIDGTTLCADTATIAVRDSTIYPVITGESISEDVICNTGNGNGSITLSVNYDGTNVINFTGYVFDVYQGSDTTGITPLKTVNNTNVIDGLDAGQYTIVVKEGALGCSYSPYTRSVGLNPGAPVTASLNGTNNNTICDLTVSNATNYDGEIFASATEAGTFEWYLGQDTTVADLQATSSVMADTLRNLVDNLYTVVFTSDATGCDTTFEATVGPPNNIELANQDTLQSNMTVVSVCLDATSYPDGSLSAFADSVPVTDYSYVWYQGSSAVGDTIVDGAPLVGTAAVDLSNPHILRNVPTGQYTMVATSLVTGCTLAPITAAVDSATLLPDAVFSDTVNVRVCDDTLTPDGAITVTGLTNGVNNGYTFEFYDAASPATGNLISHGTAGVVISTSGTNQASITNIPIDNYSVRLRDAVTACHADHQFNLVRDNTNYPFAFVTSTVANTECDGVNNGNGQAAVASISGGVGDSLNYSYLWFRGTATNDTIPMVTKSIGSLSPGDHMVQVTDEVGCTGAAMGFNVGDNPEQLGLTLSSITDSLQTVCNLALQAPNGAHEVAVTSSAGAGANYGYELFRGSNNTTNAINDADPTAPNAIGQVGINAVNIGATNDKVFITGLNADGYTVRITDNATTCDTTYSFLIQDDLTVVSNNITGTANTTKNQYCDPSKVNGTATLASPSGGLGLAYSAYWLAAGITDTTGLTASTSVNSLASASYNMIIQDDSTGCLSDPIVFAIADSVPDLSFSDAITANSVCDTANIASNGSNTVTALITDNITTPSSFSFAYYFGGNTSGTAISDGDPLPVGAGTIDTAVVNSTTSLISGLNQGTYTVQITDNESGCAFDSTFNITNIPHVPVVSGLSTNGVTVCEGSAAYPNGDLQATTTNVLTTVSYAWFFGNSAVAGNAIDNADDILTQKGTGNATPNVTGAATANIFNLDVGTYTLRITDDSTGCLSTKMSTDIGDSTVTPVLTAAVTAEQSSCDFSSPNGAAAVVSPVVGSSYTWFDGVGTSGTNLGVSTTINSLGAQPYTVQVTDANACMNDTTITIPANIPDIELDLVNTVSMSACNTANGEIELSIDTAFMSPAIGYTNTGYNIQWFQGLNTTDSLNTGDAISYGSNVAYTNAIAAGVSTTNITGLPAGLYTAIVTDNATTCLSDTIGVEVEDITIAPVFAFVSDTAATDCNDNGGAIDLKIKDAISTYAFEWYEGSLNYADSASLGTEITNSPPNPLIASSDTSSILSKVSSSIYTLVAIDDITGCRYQHTDDVPYLGQQSTAAITVVNSTTCEPFNGKAFVGLDGADSNVGTPDDNSDNYDFFLFVGTGVPADKTTGFFATEDGANAIDTISTVLDPIDGLVVFDNLPPGIYTAIARQKASLSADRCYTVFSNDTVTQEGFEPIISTLLDSANTYCDPGLGFNGSVEVGASLNVADIIQPGAFSFVLYDDLDSLYERIDVGLTTETAHFDSLSAGDYYVLVDRLGLTGGTATNGCQDSVAFTIDDEPGSEFLISAVETDITSCQDPVGGIEITSLGLDGKDPSGFSFTWIYTSVSPTDTITNNEEILTGYPVNPHDNQIIGNLPVGQYRVIATSDTTGCSSNSLDASLIKAVPDPLLSIVDIVTDSSCIVTGDQGLGGLGVSVDNLAGSTFTYQWFQGIDTATSLVDIPGSISGVSTANLSNVAGGDSVFYTVQVIEDITKCTSTISADVPAAEEQINISAILDVSLTHCSPPNGELEVTAVKLDGVTAPTLSRFAISWYNNLADVGGTADTTGASYTGRDVGSYFAQVMDTVTQCFSDVKKADVKDSTIVPAISVDIVANNSSCNANGNGILSANVNGDTLGYSFVWTNTGTGLPVGTNSPILTGLSAGRYTVTVTDTVNNLGCMSTRTDSIQDVALIVSATTESTDLTSCMGGPLNGTASVSEVAVNGVTAPSLTDFRYTWYNSLGTPISPAMSTIDSLTGLSDGTYYVVIQDIATSCSTDSLTIMVSKDTLNPTINISIDANDLSCDNITGTGELTASATGSAGTSFTYSWNSIPAQGTANAIGLIDSTYTVTVTDNINNCTQQQAVILPQENNFIQVFASATAANTNCTSPNGAVEVSSVQFNGVTTPLGEFMISWADTSDFSGTVAVRTDSTDLSGGTYYVAVRHDTTGCIADTVSVAVQDNSTLPIVTFTQEMASSYCSAADSLIGDGRLSIAVNGLATGYDYTWFRGTGTAVTDSLFIAANQGSADLVSNTEIDSLGAGTYSVMVTDNATPDLGCSVVASFEIEADSMDIIVPLASIVTQKNISCDPANGTGQVSITAVTVGGVNQNLNNYSYDWGASIATNSPVISGLSAGTYSVTLTDNVRSCTNRTAINAAVVDSLSYPNASFVTAPNVHCDPTNPTGSILATASLNSQNLDNRFTFTWTDENGNSIIGDQPLASSHISLLDTIFSGQYDLTVTDTVTTCASPFVNQIDSVVIVPQVIVPSVRITNDSICNMASGAVALENSDVGGNLARFTFQWKDGSQNDLIGETGNTITGLDPGNYFVLITDTLTGCTDLSDAVRIRNHEQIPVLNFSTTDVIGCSDALNTGGIALSIDALTSNAVASGYTIGWSGGNTTGSDSAMQVLNNRPVGTYTASVTNAFNCVNTGMAIIERDSLPVGITGTTTTDQSFCSANGSAKVTGISINGVDAPIADFSFVWMDASRNVILGEDTDSLVARTGGTYFVEATQTTTLCSTGTFQITIDSMIVRPNLRIAADMTDISCNMNGTGKLSVEILNINGTANSYLYSWHAGLNAVGSSLSTADSLVDRSAGQYSVSVTDTTTNCTSVAAASVISDPINPILVNLSLDPNTNCIPGNGQIIVSTVSFGMIDGYETILYDKDLVRIDTTFNGVFDSLSAGTYFVTATDTLYGCETGISQKEILDSASHPVITFDDLQYMDNEYCSDVNSNGSLGILDLGAGFTYQWEYIDATPATLVGSSATLTDVTDGEYMITVTDTATNCASNENYVIGQVNPLANINVDLEADFSCSEATGRALVKALVLNDISRTPDYGYYWFEGDSHTDFTDTIGSVHVGADFRNLDANDQYSVIVYDNVDSTCGKAVSVTIPDGTMTPEINIAELAKLTTCSPFDPNGILRVEIMEPQNAPTTVLWSTMDADTLATTKIIKNLTNNIDYNVLVTNLINGCFSASNAQVGTDQKFVSPPEIAIRHQVTSCATRQDGIAEIFNSSTDYSYEWFNSGDLDNVLGTGTSIGNLAVDQEVVARQTDLMSGCVSESSGNVTILDEIEAPKFTVTTKSSDCISNVIDGNLLKNYNGVATLELGDNIAFGSQLSNELDTTVVNGNIVITRNNIVQKEVKNIQWIYEDNILTRGVSDEEINDIFLGDAAPGSYEVILTDTDECSDTASFEITTDIFIYNGISDDNNGKNDFFLIDCIDEFPNNKVKIFSPQGALVYQVDGYDNENPDKRFNGYSNSGLSIGNNKLPEGTYFYYLEKGDNTEPYQGYLELIR